MQNFQIEIWTWVLLFVIYLFFDSAYVFYIKAVSKSQALKASILSVAMYLLTAYGTIEYIENIANLVPILVGSFLGNYITLKISGKGENKG